MNIGILGGGQLGKMLALAGKELGHEFVILDPNPEACAAVTGTHIVAAFDDKAALQQLADQVDIVTYEFENLPLASVQFVQKTVPVFPSVQALAVTQDRGEEKALCKALDIPTATYKAVDTEADLTQAVADIGMPCIVKTRRMGYDGKGQVFLQSEANLPAAVELVNKQPCILEQCISFQKEVSIIATRSISGEIVYYPLTENTHKEGILAVSKAPAVINKATANAAQQIAKRILEHFAYVGTLAIEFFVMEDGELLVNEMAPRVHNSGHWTIEGAKTSQFANHIRAITGMPLGDTSTVNPSVMLNVIGTFPPSEEWSAMEGVAVHVYGKADRPKRKIGHVTVSHSDEQHREACVQQISADL